jgi:hypothetical protein
MRFVPVCHQYLPVPDEQLPMAAVPALHPCSVPPVLHGLSANPPEAHCWPTPRPSLEDNPALWLRGYLRFSIRLQMSRNIVECSIQVRTYKGH